MMRHLSARNLRRELLGADWDSMLTSSKFCGGISCSRQIAKDAGICGACCNPSTAGLTDLQDLPDFPDLFTIPYKARLLMLEKQ